jgi:hypothetical protein
MTASTQAGARKRLIPLDQKLERSAEAMRQATSAPAPRATISVRAGGQPCASPTR